MKLLGLLLLLGCGLFAQEAPKAQVPKSPPPDFTTATIVHLPTLAPETYALPTEVRGAIRDLQYANDQLEIENQKLLLRVEQNRAKQAEIIDKMKSVAFDFANRNQINLDLYELDPTQVSFVKRKKTGQ